MNTGMLNNPFVQKNIKSLQNEGAKIVESETGLLACGYKGKGKMASVEKIYEKIIETISPAQVSTNLTQKKTYNNNNRWHKRMDRPFTLYL